MKEPVHNVKRQVKRNLDKSYHWAEPFQVYGWLGSGVKDRNGVEIFEGDLVNCGSIDGVMTVVFNRGVFCLENHIETYELPDCKADTFEVIGHIAENGK